MTKHGLLMQYINIAHTQITTFATESFKTDGRGGVLLGLAVSG